MKLLEGEREDILENVDETLENYQLGRENLIPILQEVQRRLGYLPKLAMEKVAEKMDIPAVDIFGLVTFFNQFRLNPPGEHEIKVCMGTACYMTGGQVALDSFERRLGIKEGETTPDRKFSLERVACVGCCSMAPVVVINDSKNDNTVEGHVTPTRVDGLMLAFEEDEKKNGEKDNEEEQQQEEGK